MNYKNVKFKIAILGPLIYEISMIIFQFDGLSLPKLIITSLLWLSFWIAFLEFFNNKKLYRKKFTKLSYIVLLLLFLWNSFLILRSFYIDYGKITTLLGNIYTSLGLLIPFAIIFGIRKINVRIMNIFFNNLILVGLSLSLVFFVFGNGVFGTAQLQLLIFLLTPSIFLITSIPFHKKKNKVIILIGSVFLFYFAYKYGSRTMLLREFLLFFGLIVIYIYIKFKFKWILKLSFLFMIIPFLLLKQSIDTGVSAFEEYLSPSSDSDLNTDTRTFLYIEVFEDLLKNNSLIIGKGASGTYYSNYFSTEEGDSDTRLTVEVGILALLLKGGGIAVLLNLIILIIAIYLAFFKSSNNFVVSLGFILIIHLFLLFVENLISYSSYNFFIWMIIGLCLSKDIRSLKRTEIKYII